MTALAHRNRLVFSGSSSLPLSANVLELSSFQAVRTLRRMTSTPPYKAVADVFRSFGAGRGMGARIGALRFMVEVSTPQCWQRMWMKSPWLPTTSTGFPQVLHIKIGGFSARFRIGFLFCPSLSTCRPVA